MISSLDAAALVAGGGLISNSCARDVDVDEGGAVFGAGGIAVFCTPLAKN